jgi:serine/threonine-protein kinase
MTGDALSQLNASLAGRYAVQRVLGRGGAAIVYLAEDLKHHRNVALKVIRPDLAEACGADRFLREIAIAAKLGHPHILPLYDSAEVDGSFFYTMPYVEGGTLRSRLEAEGRLDLRAAVEMVCVVASALEYAHAQGLVHRDIKPENILLYEGTAMVSDFGIAVALDAGARGRLGSALGDRLTETGLVVGTAAYMSPEQAAGEGEVDARSDVYSLACVLYEMLTGEPPHKGRSAVATMASRLHSDAVPASRLRPGIPAAVDQALMRALAREPAQRFATAKAFGDALAEALAAGTAPPRRRSVAVLPFLNIGGDPENSYFADGISEDVIAHLTKVRDLEVISRSSAAKFRDRDLSPREIGAQLHVATLLEGSVRRAGNRVRIVAQLVDVESDKHLWAETYDRDLTDIFAIQTDVALQIAAALRAELSQTERERIGREPTSNLAAYELYLRGRQQFVRFTPTSIRQAAVFFEAAVAEDASFALGYVALCTAYTELAEIGAVQTADSFAKARAAVTRAIALDDESGDAHAALAHLLFVAEFDFVNAEREFRRALVLSPGSADAHDHFGRMLSSLGRFDEALAHVNRARALDPLSAPVDHTTVLLRMGRYAEALPLARSQVIIDPENARARATLGWALYLTGSAEEGVQELERAAGASTVDDSTWLAQLGALYGLVGRVADARAVQGRLEALSRERFVSPYHFAYVHVGLGEFDLAMDRLEQAYEERGGSMYGIKTSFLFTPLRSHPRFVALLKKLNLD